MSVSDIMNVIIRDREYYISSGGGLTFSGGEAFTQFDGLMKLLLRARQEDIPVAIETSGQVLQENLRRAYPLIHLFLFDMKHPDKYLLKKYTGADYDTILSNLTWIAEQNPAKVIARIPIIPGFNYDMHTIRELFLLLSERRIRQVHLLPYHTLGENKYRQLGLSCLYPSHRMLTKEDLLPLKDMGEGIGLRIWIGG
jgi:pyruvate formate lyase activating enzyme